MPYNFPGMNPYLEHPELFPGLHHLVISEIARFLSPQLRPKYRVAVEVRMYETTDENSYQARLISYNYHSHCTPPLNPLPVDGEGRQSIAFAGWGSVGLRSNQADLIKVKIPMPVAIKEGYLEVREVGTEALVTTIEILSPTNKRPGKGRQVYEEKREQVLASRSNLVEIDLLRKGDPMPMIGNNIQSHYRILVCRGDRRPYADLYAFNLQDVIPSFPLPLRSGDTELIIDLQALLNEVYDIYGYDLVVDYSQQPVPALSEADAAWVDALLRDKGVG